MAAPSFDERVLWDIVEQHAAEAAFLWTMRTNATIGHFTLSQLHRIDSRVEAHFDGLREARESAAQLCHRRTAENGAGSHFVSSVLTLERHDPDDIGRLLAVMEALPPRQSELVSACGWVDPRCLQGTVKNLLDARSPFWRGVGITCCALQGVNPIGAIEAALDDANAPLRARALRAAGELGRRELSSRCERHLSDSEEDCRLEAERGAVLLGVKGKVLESLTQTGLSAGRGRVKAFRLMLQALDQHAAHSILQGIAREGNEQRWLIHGSGIVGNPEYVPWLIGHMAQPAMARIAADAFTTITGAELIELGLDGDPPQDLETTPNDDPNDPNVDIDPDEGLPWPDVPKIERWWAENGSRFQSGTRYFMGKPVTREHCIDVLKNGYQRQRILAAHYLCLLEPGTPLFNTSAPAWRQQRLLAKMA